MSSEWDLVPSAPKFPKAPAPEGAAPKVHAALGASGADRWINCPGSIAIAHGLPDPETEHSREGTAAHALFELALKRNSDPDVWLDVELEGVRVTEDMVTAVRVFVDLVRDIWTPAVAAHPNSRLWIETNFSLASLSPPAPMHGTADIVIYDGHERRLYVLDYKHGVGYAVSAKGNPQLRYYGLGALLVVEREIGSGAVDQLELVIVQPRAAHPEGIIRRDFLNYGDMVDFGFTLIEAAHAALAPNAPRVPGGWCRFCKAAAVCPEKQEEAQALAQVEFASDDIAPPPPEKLPMEALLRVLAHKDTLTKWLRDVERFVHGELEAGRPVPGWKLVAKRAIRQWSNQNEARKWLEESGYPQDEYLTEPEVKSPAQIEKLMKQYGEKKPAIPAELIVKESSGTTLAPEYDERPAVGAGPTAEFHQ